LIRFLRAITPEGQVTVGFTNQDISDTKGDIQDYGIMGLGYQPGPSCVVSTFRLSKKNILEQYFKLTIHELGHTQGLPHCPVKTCFMRDAEGKNHADEETEFCTNCKTHLMAKGWTFKK
jgi:archaemetzincin